MTEGNYWRMPALSLNAIGVGECFPLFADSPFGAVAHFARADTYTAHVMIQRQWEGLLSKRPEGSTGVWPFLGSTIEFATGEAWGLKGWLSLGVDETVTICCYCGECMFDCKGLEVHEYCGDSWDEL